MSNHQITCVIINPLYFFQDFQVHEAVTPRVLKLYIFPTILTDFISLIIISIHFTSHCCMIILFMIMLLQHLTSQMHTHISSVINYTLQVLYFDFTENPTLLFPHNYYYHNLHTTAVLIDTLHLITLNKQYI